MIRDYVSFALLQFAARKLRTALTILGIVIGIGAIVSLVSIGQGLQDTLDQQFKTLGGNKIIVSPKGAFFGGGASASGILDESDLDVVRRAHGMHLAGGMITRLGQVGLGKEQKSTFVNGLPADTLHVQPRVGQRLP